MVVLPEKTYHSLISQQQQLVPPQVQNMANLDYQMQTTLDNSQLPSDQKAAQYDNLARRYRVLYDQLYNRPVYTGPFTPSPPSPTAVLPATPQINGDPTPVNIDPEIYKEKIVASLPSNLRNKGLLLLNHILGNSNFFKFTPKGELIDKNGSPIQGSSLIDLVHEAVRNRKSRGLDGTPEFVSMLSDTNVPKEALGTPKRLQELTTMKKPPSPLYHSTPKAHTSTVVDEEEAFRESPFRKDVKGQAQGFSRYGRQQKKRNLHNEYNWVGLR